MDVSWSCFVLSWLDLYTSTCTIALIIKLFTANLYNQPVLPTNNKYLLVMAKKQRVINNYIHDDGCNINIIVIKR